MKNHFKARHIFAFTLAEVLIVLAVIGVVAAMTILVLMGNYQKEQTVEKLKKEYTSLAQIIKISEIDNGQYSTWDYTTGAVTIAGSKAFFDKYLAPYFSFLTTCPQGINYTCGSPVSGAGVNYSLSNGVGFAVVLQAAQKVYIVIDLNGPTAPNAIGKDSFIYQITPTGGLVGMFYQKGMTRAQVIDNGIYHCNEANKHMCAALIMFDGWQISDDYPWQ